MTDFVFEEMTPELQIYLNEKDYETRKELHEKLPKDLLRRYWKARKAWLCRDETSSGGPKIHTSPSGQYRLEVTSHGTGEGTWAYTKGRVFHGDTLVGEIVRNYSSFPFEWIEGHPNGHSYLVGGEDYQGQTVIELDTGKRRDFLPEEADRGHGFCWASYEYKPEFQVMMVEGCYWASTYEFRLYDFSDPMNGWPLLEIEGTEDGYIDISQKSPTIDAEGIVTVYQVRDEYDIGDYYSGEAFDEAKESLVWEGAEDDRYAVVATKTYRIQGKKLVFQSEWVSDFEKAYREEQEKSRLLHEAQEKEFKATDPLYLAFAEGLKDPALSPEKCTWSGVTYKGWCPGLDLNEPRRSGIIVKRQKGHPYEIQLDWAVFSRKRTPC